MIAAKATKTISIFDRPIKFTNRFVEVKTFLYSLSEQHNWSLIVSKDVTSHVKEIKGSTIREILDSYLTPMNLSWKFKDECLYVARSNILNNFFKELPVLEMQLPPGKKGSTLSCTFKSIDITLLCQFIRDISNADIRAETGIEANIMMRSISMPWKRIVCAIIYLNRFRAVTSEYSLFICPQETIK